MIKRILVALHDREDPGTCLAKAAQLEHACGAVVEVVQTCWDAISDEPTEHFPQEEIDSIATRLKATELRNLSATLADYRTRYYQLKHPLELMALSEPCLIIRTKEKLRAFASLKQFTFL